MAHRSQPAACRGRRGWLGLALLALALPGVPVVHAQIAEVVRPDAQGDFSTLRVAGPRGSTPQRFWLVVDRDPRGLLCRDGQGRAWITLHYGAVMQLDQPDQQRSPRWIEGHPTLRLAVKPLDILSDVRFSRDRGQAMACWVRANSAVLSPIQEDSLEQALDGPRIRP